MGKFVNGEFVDLAIEPIIQRANAITISVNFGIGRSRKVSATEFVIEQTFVNAIRGDVKAHKDIVKWSKKYLRNEKKRRPMTKSRRIMQSDVDQWKAAGVLAPKSSGNLEKMSLAELNKSYRAFNRIQDQTRGWVKSPRQWRKLFDGFREHLIAKLEADAKRAKK